MSPDWSAVERDFVAWMNYRNLAESTQQIYSSAVRELAAFLAADGRDPTPVDVHRHDIEAFVRHRLHQVKPATVSADFRALQQSSSSSGWCVRRRSTAPPSTERKARSCRSVLELGQLRAVLDSCKSNSFVDRRDQAIFRLLIDTGGRLGEIAGLMGPSGNGAEACKTVDSACVVSGMKTISAKAL